MKVAIVILNWNGQQMLAEYLATVLEYSRDEATIIVADNASTDGSMRFLKARFPEVPTIPLDQNYGFAEGYDKARPGGGRVLSASEFRCRGYPPLADPASGVYGQPPGGCRMPAQAPLHGRQR